MQFVISQVESYSNSTRRSYASEGIHFHNNPQSPCNQQCWKRRPIVIIEQDGGQAWFGPVVNITCYINMLIYVQSVSKYGQQSAIPMQF